MATEKLRPVRAVPGLAMGADEMTADELYEGILLSRDLERRARVGRQRLEFEALRRREERGGTKDQTARFDVAFEPRRTYAHLDDKLDELAKHLDPQQFEALYAIKRTWNQSRLNQAAKLGGEVARIIQEGSSVNNEDWKIDVKERK